MVLLDSLSLDMNMVMPDFSLLDPEGVRHSTQSCMGTTGLLIIFTCNHCPYAQAIWPRSIHCAALAKPLGIHTVAINPNINPLYPDDSPEAMKTMIHQLQIPFPYLIDDTQSTAQAFQAQCTPDIYLLRSDCTLFYHGRLDDHWQDESQVSVHELQDAIHQLSRHLSPPTTQHPCIGCSIKWR